MDRFNKTLLLLNHLISKLQANTGGQMSKQENQNTQVIHKQPTTDTKKEELKAQNAQTNVEAKVEEKTQQKKGKKEKKTEENRNNGPKVEEGQQQDKQVKKEKKTEKKGEKNEKKQQKQETKKEENKKQQGSDEATVQDFAAIDIRIGEITQCWKHPQSQKLYCQKINISGQVRQIASGLQQHIPIGDMKGLVIVMANLKPRPLAKFMSNGMVVCASNHEHTIIHLIRPDGQIGERAYLQGHEGLFKNVQLLPVLNPKKKILQKCIQHFKTDEEGFITWKGIKLKTSGGFLKSQIKNGNVS